MAWCHGTCAESALFYKKTFKSKKSNENEQKTRETAHRQHTIIVLLTSHSVSFYRFHAKKTHKGDDLLHFVASPLDPNPRPEAEVWFEALLTTHCCIAFFDMMRFELAPDDANDAWLRPSG